MRALPFCFMLVCACAEPLSDEGDAFASDDMALAAFDPKLVDMTPWPICHWGPLDVCEAICSIHLRVQEFSFTIIPDVDACFFYVGEESRD